MSESVPQSSPHSTAPAGWYTDPWVKDHRRYWDGQQWTHLSRPPWPPSRVPLPMRILYGMASVAGQGGVLLVTVLLGMEWETARTLDIALTQAGAGLAVIVVLALTVRHGPTLVLLLMAVPVLSYALTFAMQAWGEEIEYSLPACTSRDLSASRQLAALPGTKPIFKERISDGRYCGARFHTQARPAEVVAHYHQQLTAHGWRIQERDSSWLTASRNGVYFQVIPDRRKGGPTFVELVVSDRD